ncbi:asparaginase [Fodinibius halophilus]|uniref:asparaginase n=1 Tax=Fodinibius halophilus TaxID=1736908 RepID=A0A6M1T667_9BACT|nr:asparaginase [Fodinibius halophilus]NGP86754.1 asparaginase [Fodinibius halophilus]
MKKILLIQTGGTIAMDISDSEQPQLNSEKWAELMYQAVPELSEIAEIHIERLFFEDSSDINKKHWGQLATLIYDRYSAYDGFVILHGTDTMAYTASALSFALQDLSKPIILTGSQVPMSNIRSDARRNLVNAVEMATMALPEVAICFNDFVYRGNRATKISIGDFDAFASPNYPPLAEIGLNIEMSDNVLPTQSTPTLNTSFSDELFLLKIYPNLDPAFLEQIDFTDIRALVIEAFGSGNFPIRGKQSLLPFFKKCIANNTLLIIGSQAAYDAVELSNYESGNKAKSMGALSAKDMTTEATLTKMMYLLAKHNDNDNVAAAFNKNLVGELTE